MSRRSKDNGDHSLTPEQPGAAAAETPRPPDFYARAATALYYTAWWPALPFALLRLAASRRRRPGLARIRAHIPAFADRPLWVHACSVGETIAVLPLVDALRESRPDVPVVLTVATATGMDVARERAQVPVTWFPFDHPLCVRDFFHRLRPRALVLMESELWPGVLNRAHALRVPVVLVNGRFSDASAKNRSRFNVFLRGAVRPIALAGVQTEAYADRLEAIGADRSRIEVTGNLKFGAAPVPLPDEERRALRASLGIPPGTPVLVFGSTRPGDESIAARCLRGLFEIAPDLRVVVAPRHVHRVAEAESPFAQWNPVRRSTIAKGSATDARVILLDTLGELARVYSVATLAVVGGSFGGDIGGHNPIEPAAQGVPVVVGPDVRNFTDVVEILVSGCAAMQVRDADELARTLAALMRDAERRRHMGACALHVVSRHRETLTRTRDLVLRVVDSARNAGA